MTAARALTSARSALRSPLLRRRAISSLESLGVAEPVRRVRELCVPVARRNRLDNERLHLLLTFLLRTDSNCIDVGANVGDILGLFVQLAPSGHHIAYEPLPDLAGSLKIRFPDVDVRQRALSDRLNTTAFTYVKSNPAYSGFRPRTYPRSEQTEEIVVQTEALDESLPPGYVPTLLKVDVEGAEQQVLEGAVRTLSVHKPVVVFEHGYDGASHYGTKPSDIFSVLCNEARLRIFDLDGNGPLSAGAFDEVAAKGSGRWNFVAHA